MKRILALDFEAGGIEPKERGPVTLGLAVFDSETEELASSHEWLFQPIRNAKTNKLKFTYTHNASEIHGYGIKRMAHDGLPAETIYREVAEFIGGSWDGDIVSHDAAFDSDVWGNLLFALGRWDNHVKQFIAAKEILTGPWRCTRRMASGLALAPSVTPDIKLDTLSKHFGFGGQGEVHGAVKDAIICGRVFFALRKIQQERAVAA